MNDVAGVEDGAGTTATYGFVVTLADDVVVTNECGEVTSVAPSLMRALVPPERGSSGEPGTAKTRRPWSAA